ncbi:MAG: NAD(P)H-dependent oxidoreductase [Firmicutes bacterium]|nr:NAD(P)H-dependent oxidoreductase [Bacillota bacterium]
MTNQLNIGIILGSTREGRVSPQVGKWVKELADKKGNANYQIVDIKSYHLPLLGESTDTEGIMKWNAKLAELDGFIFVTAEYNHGMPASLKNALDLAKDAWNNKAAGIISYGSAGGARAAEHLKGVLGELQIADVRAQVLLSLFTDFENYSNFKPQALHQANMDALLDQVVSWSTTLKQIRK